ncbi:hypothetical protein J2S74_000509 [Evansella vedderi]|uniref:Uncharacterized protein n=1 Tax=Evansella vedderi TaxID=38282 RepID=A0ABT9ZQX9_9BACI|nr:hypothetical protein [Evansella vedderi]MDQ0253137.1 hypothetical protein [Evansella vedderi]
MNKARVLIQMAAIYAVIGVFIGSHMAGAADYRWNTVHGHILLVGWLSLFAFGIFYAVFRIPKESKLANAHVWTAVFGSIGLTTGMWMYFFQPGFVSPTFSLIYFIVGGTILAVSFLLFLIMTFRYSALLNDGE